MLKIAKTTRDVKTKLQSIRTRSLQWCIGKIILAACLSEAPQVRNKAAGLLLAPVLTHLRIKTTTELTEELRIKEQ